MIMGLRYKTSGHEKSVKPPLSMSQGPCKTHILMISPVHAYQRRDGTYSNQRCLFEVARFRDITE